MKSMCDKYRWQEYLSDFERAVSAFTTADTTGRG